MRSPRHRPALSLLLAALAVWGGAFIWRTSFVSSRGRTFVLFDDAMISMTYARNLVEGHGLAWAREGAPVEGFTTPLWTLAMVPVNLLPLPLTLRSAPMQLLSLGLLLLLVVAVRRLMLAHLAAGRGDLAAWLPAALLTAFCYPLDYWALMGMETGLQAVLAVVTVGLAFDLAAGRRRYAAFFGVAAVAYLVRMDMVVLSGVATLWAAAHGAFPRRAARRWLAAAALPVAAALGYELFRWLYYGDLLPNTYYLKVAGVPLALRLTRGWTTARGFLAANAVALAAVGAAVACAGREVRRRLVLPLAVFVAYLGYSVWVGGDAWEIDLNVRANRFVAPALPLLFAAFNAGLLGARRRLADRWWRLLPPVATLLVLVAADGLWLSPRAAENRRNMAVLDRPLLVSSHAVVLAGLGDLERLLGPGARVVTYWAGIPAYFSDYRMVDALGYNDAELAHRPLPSDVTLASYLPGHNKGATPRELLAGRPDAFFQFWTLALLDNPWPRHYMRWHGYFDIQWYEGESWLRRDSPYLTPAGRRLAAAAPGRD